MKQLFMFGWCLFLSAHCIAQTTRSAKDSAGKFLHNNIYEFNKRVTTDPFPPIGKWKDITGKEFDFNAISRAAVIRFGFRGCPPCKSEMKTFIKLSKEYKNVDFLYVTYDSPQEIGEDIKAFYPDVGRMRFISIPQTYINAYRLTFGYPCTYLVQAPNDVLHVENGGTVDKDSIVLTYYRHTLDSVFAR